MKTFDLQEILMDRPTLSKASTPHEVMQYIASDERLFCVPPPEILQ